MAINYEKAWNTLKGNMKLWIDGLKDNPHAECYKYIKTMYQIEDNSKTRNQTNFYSSHTNKIK